MKGQLLRLSPGGAYVIVTRVGGPAIEIYDARTEELLHRDPRVNATAGGFWTGPKKATWRQELTGSPPMRWAYTIGDVDPRPMGLAPGTQFVAADKHTASWGRETKVLRYDGAPLVRGCGGALALAGDYLGHLQKPDTDEPGQPYCIRRKGALLETVTLRAVPRDPCLHADATGWALAYGGRGARVWGHDSLGTETDLTVVPHPKTTRESQPRIVAIGDELWIGTVSVIGGRALALLRPWGDASCLQVPIGSSVRSWDLVARDGMLLVAAEDDAHEIRFIEADPAGERHAIDLPAEQPIAVPALPPALTAVYKPVDFSEPCSVTLLADPVDPVTVPTSRPVITASLDWVTPAHDVVGWLISPTDSAEAVRQAAACLAIREWPVHWYSDGTLTPELLPGIDVHWLMVYAVRDRYTPEAVEARWRQDWAADAYARAGKAGVVLDFTRHVPARMSPDDVMRLAHMYVRVLPTLQPAPVDVVAWAGHRGEPQAGLAELPLVMEQWRRIVAALEA